MTQINETTQGVLDQISEGFDQNGAYNLRQNGVSICHGDSEHIRIRKKEDKPGIDILIDGDTKGERVFIPVVVSVSGMISILRMARMLRSWQAAASITAAVMRAAMMAFIPFMLERMPMFIMKRNIMAKEMEPEAVF